MIWLLMVLLCNIAIVLIVPEVDLPDTAFQRNSSPLTVHAVSHQVPGLTRSYGLLRIPEQSSAFAPQSLPRDGNGVDLQHGPSLHSETLRC